MKNIIETFSLDSLYPRSKSLHALHDVLKETGFFFLTDHGLSPDTIASMEHDHKAFFGLREEKRLQYHYPETHGQKGYTPFRVETGEFFGRPDEKRFIHTFPGDTPYIKEVPRFQQSANAMWHEFNNLASRLMEAIALSLELPLWYFNGPEKGYSILRGIHYPAQLVPLQDEGEAVSGGNILGMCASKHTDINMITLLLAREAGLQLFHKNEWVPITIDNPNMIIVNCGDMLEHLTNGLYKSGLHRVVCQKDTERYSYPFFLHVPSNFNIEPLHQFGERQEKYSFKTAGQFLDHRLEQINLK